MSERITIVLDTDLAKKLRSIQAEQIRHEQKSISFSSVINSTLRKSLK
ncbi:hypothetical protein HOV56_gp45 [Nitrosopumilus spindle-shaped virus]|uniref:Ribbon-helix-helix protein CopG domain-containing protein n=1 Tax=Nitrosopumilus spindle-shaped virus TaxID=2508184 RepID=A0A514K2U0_9VIRU|nr:hypothetical protein HOV56_gp45 [Nitrosopumilus spindle-shaped virus]YP_010772874.1 hypothetical protein QIT54_gp44 [Nitrosopumilus spindle-shaped virus]QDI73934.1 hypothetical protein [Nitrosopumilus spindle-shaped virus]QDI73982.1 hypothetical protein [Nitrosopumilus spindle-shaped virus]